MEIESAQALDEAVAKKAAGTEIKLAILRAGREKRLALKLGARPAQFVAAKPSADAPLPMLDTGGHMAMINGIAFTPDGRQLVSASDDKTIRVWDLASGKTVRTIRGESAPGEAGKVHAMALSPDGKWLAAGGSMATFDGANHIEIGTIRLYEFASSRLVALLKGHDECGLGPRLLARWQQANFGQRRQHRHHLGHRDTSRRPRDGAEAAAPARRA